MLLLILRRPGVALRSFASKATTATTTTTTTTSTTIVKKFIILTDKQRIRHSRIIRARPMNADTPETPHQLKGRQMIVLAGATSVGKSAVAAELCKRINAEIILADSVQIYKKLDIGSNKPSKEEMEAVPHHLVDLRDPHETFSCGDFVRAAAPIIYDILLRGKVPVLVGGSTMWIQWLVHGMPDAPKADDEVIKKAEEMLKPFVDTNDWVNAAQLVCKYDRVRVEKLGTNDWYRLHRYLEVALSIQRRDGTSPLESNMDVPFTTVSLSSLSSSSSSSPLLGGDGYGGGDDCGHGSGAGRESAAVTGDKSTSTTKRGAVKNHSSGDVDLSNHATSSSSSSSSNNNSNNNDDNDRNKNHRNNGHAAGSLTASSSSSTATTPAKRPREDEESSAPFVDGGDEVGLESEGILTGKRKQVLDGIDVRCFFLSEEREELYHFIDSRCEVMLKAGLFQEVTQLLLDDALTPESVAAKAIGYRQTIDYLCSDSWKPFDVKAFENFVKGFATATRNYAKRQLQWYRRDKSFLWLKIDRRKGASDPEPYQRVCTEIQHWCSQSPEQFGTAVRHQILRGLAVTAARKRIHHDHQPKTTEKMYAFEALMAVSDPDLANVAVPLISPPPSSFTSSVSMSPSSSSVAMPTSSLVSSRDGGRKARRAKPAGGISSEEDDDEGKGEEEGGLGFGLGLDGLIDDDDDFRFTDAELAAVDAVSKSRKGDVDLSQILPEPVWTAEGMVIRAAEGQKRSTVLLTYQNRMKTDNLGSGSEFDELIREADRCAQLLREKHPAIVREFSAASKSKIAAGTSGTLTNSSRKSVPMSERLPK